MTLGTNSYDTRAALQRQLDIAWNFATDFILDQIDHDLALWKPAPDSVTVHPTGSGWVADWPSEDGTESLPPATIGWSLWHIEWGWTNTLATVNREAQISASDFRWSGGTQHLAGLKRRWDRVLATDDLERLNQWVMPAPRPLSYIAGLVNFELTKNLAEINQLKMLHASKR